MCKNLETITLPDGICIIDDYAFDRCENLKNINIPNTVKRINDCTFYKCNSLQTIEIPNSVEEIKSLAFLGCSSLNFIEIPDGLVSIGSFAFAGCDSLTKIIIPNSIKQIMQDSFKSITEFDDGSIMLTKSNLKNLVLYANSDSYARKYANQNEIKFCCLNEHDWDAGIITIKPTLISEGQKTFTCTACKIIKKQKISKIDIPKKGENITDPKTENSFNVTNPAIKNGTVEIININVNKSTITIPDSITVDGANYKVTSVSKNVFKNNKRIKKIIIGKSIKSIGSNAFSGCTNLKKIIIKSKQIKSVGKNAFKGINPKADIKVPKKKLEFYQNLFAKKGQKSTVKITK